MPNVKELQSIANYQNFNPAVSPAFNNGCAPGCTVLTCSCTVSNTYWSSTTYPSPSGGTVGFVVYFNDGSVRTSDKSVSDFVRAVRGGL